MAENPPCYSVTGLAVATIELMRKTSGASRNASSLAIFALGLACEIAGVQRLLGWRPHSAGQPLLAHHCAGGAFLSMLSCSTNQQGRNP